MVPVFWATLYLDTCIYRGHCRVTHRSTRASRWW